MNGNYKSNYSPCNCLQFVRGVLELVPNSRSKHKLMCAEKAAEAEAEGREMKVKTGDDALEVWNMNSLELD